ncbi:MAG: hypothetical protein JO227_19460 [Acetobacteraceae bacterium]|nr:hypothetical protein [Acetobacteraceae bacterium]
MQSLRLARIAAEAEGLRLRTQLQRTVMRIGLAVVAFVFLSAALIFAHIAVWYCLRLYAGWGQPGTGFAVMGGDLVITLVLLLLASRSSPGRVELEALQVRQRALQSAARTVTVSAALMPVIRMAAGLIRGRRVHARRRH